MDLSTGADLSRIILFPSAVILLVLGAIGLYGHFCIIWATFKFKEFHLPCSIFIALLAAGDFGHQISHIPYTAMILSGIPFISQRTCFWIQLLPAISMQHSVVTTGILGIDRLICVAKPITYRNISSSKKSQFYYILGLNIVPFLYIVCLSSLSYQEMTKDPNKDTLCLIVAVFAGDAEQFWSLSAMFFTTATVAIYAALWIYVWRRTAALASIKSTLKPLTIILGITVFGWFLGMAMVSYISKMNDLNKNLRVALISYAGISINLAVSSNYFVYRLFGSEYKKAFKKLWKSNASSITPTA